MKSYSKKLSFTKIRQKEIESSPNWYVLLKAAIINAGGKLTLTDQSIRDANKTDNLTRHNDSSNKLVTFTIDNQ